MTGMGKGGKNSPQEIVTGVDAARNPLENSGVWGVENSLIYTQPDEVITSVSGGGSVTFDKFGARVDAGTTSGDTAEIARESNTYLAAGLSSVTTYVLYSVFDATPTTDDVEIGLAGSARNQDRGAYLDLAAGQYHVGTSTAAATLPASQTGTLLKITQDFAAGETVFEQQGGVSETVTINTTDDLGEVLIGSNSNGSGELVMCPWYRTVLEP